MRGRIDGYTARERGKFIKDAKRLAATLFAYEPYKSRKSDFNVWALCPEDRAVCAGETARLVPDCAPAPEMDTAAPPVTVHAKVVELPTAIVLGLAVKL